MTKRALLAITLAIGLVGAALALSVQPAAAVNCHPGSVPQNHCITAELGYHSANLYGVDISFYWWEETRYMMENSGFASGGWGAPGWVSPANFVQITDNQGKQDASSWVLFRPDGQDGNTLHYDNFCHTGTGQCIGSVTMTLRASMVYAAWGWFGNTPQLMVLRAQNNSQLHFAWYAHIN